jgi:hypothetical protein
LLNLQTALRFLPDLTFIILHVTAKSDLCMFFIRVQVDTLYLSAIQQNQKTQGLPILQIMLNNKNIIIVRYHEGSKELNECILLLAHMVYL